MSRLTVSQEHYLSAVCILEAENTDVRLVNVADMLNVSKASACAAIKKLENKGLLQRDNDRFIKLTSSGKCEAARVYENFVVIKAFLTNQLNIDSHTALEDAGKIVHVVSEETMACFRKKDLPSPFLGKV